MRSLPRMNVTPQKDKEAGGSDEDIKEANEEETEKDAEAMLMLRLRFPSSSSTRPLHTVISARRAHHGVGLKPGCRHTQRAMGRRV